MRTMAIHFAADHATYCAASQLSELPMQSTNKQCPSVEYISGYVCIFTGYPIDYSKC